MPGHTVKAVREFKTIQKKTQLGIKDMIKNLTSAHAFGSTKRPIRPASLALRIFSNNGMMVELELKQISQEIT